MTPEQLTQARVQEAVQRTPFRADMGGHDYGAEVALAMARLIDEDWRPEPKGPPLEAAREYLARGYEQAGRPGAARDARNGAFDEDGDILAILLALADTAKGSPAHD